MQKADEIQKNNPLKTATYTMCAHCTTVNISLLFAEDTSLEKDWLLTVELYRDGKQIQPNEIDWPYSASLDANFVYINTTDESEYNPRTISAKQSFNAIKVQIIPWSNMAKTGQLEVPAAKVTFRETKAQLEGLDKTSPVSILAIRDLRGTK